MPNDTPKHGIALWLSRKTRYAAVLVCAAATLGFFAGESAALEAGAAKSDITPPLGTPLNGYGDRLGRGALSIHDLVWARCLFLNDGETCVFLVSADLCLINRELRERVVQLAEETFLKSAPELAGQEKPSLLGQRIILAATHNHSGQGAMMPTLPFRFVSGRFMPEVLESTAQGIVKAMQEAYTSRGRAALGFAATACAGLSKNRQLDGGPVDEQLGVLRVDDADGNPIALLANFAAHPTTIEGDDFYAVSADYPGFFYSALEQLTGGKAVALFLNGAEGNQRCGNPEGKTGWDRTESIGRLLAVNARKAAESITCGEAKLHVGYAHAPLPPSLAARFLPPDAVLQTLEVRALAAGQDAVVSGSDSPCLLMTFLPGEPCVELGIELRRRATERGYTAQFTVAPANDYVGYFVPARLYAAESYESSMSFFGPRAENWLYDGFSALMTRGAAVAPPEIPPAQIDDANGIRHLTLSGSPYVIGFQQGAAFKEAIEEAYARRILERVASRELVPDTGLWAWAPPWMDLTPLALPYLGAQARRHLEGAAPGIFEGLMGIADGAGLPFDTIWLLHCAQAYPLEDGQPEAYPLPGGLLFAVSGDRAGAEDVLAGANIEWRGGAMPAVFSVQSSEGHSFIQVGAAADLGAFAGMNDAGVLVCAARTSSPGESQAVAPLRDRLLGKVRNGAGLPALAIRAILEQTDTFDAAVAALQSAPGIAGYHVLVAGPDAKKATSRLCILEPGAAQATREAVHGVLLGEEPAASGPKDASQLRHQRMADLLREERIISAEEIEQTLSNRQAGPSGETVFGTATRCSVVFEPKRRRIRFSAPDAAGNPGKFKTISLDVAAEAKHNG